MTIGIGLIGYGAIGRLHALCYQMLPLCYPELPPVRIVAVQTATQASAERALRELGHLRATTALDELLSDSAVQVVDCCAPTGDHARVALASLSAGKALFCEKPLAASLEEAEGIIAASEMAGVAGGINFHFRYVPALQEARRLIEAGLLGEVVGFHLRYYRSSNLRRDRALTWRFSGPGSGVLADLGSHLIDLVLHLLGPVAWVSARTRTLVTERPDAAGNLSPVEGDDAAWLQLGLAQGGHGSVEVSKLVPGAGDDLRIEAYGTNGSLIYDARDPNGLLITEGAGAATERRVAAQSRTLPPASLPSPETPTGAVGWHLASIRAFLGAYVEGSTPSPSLIEGFEVDRVIAAARRSAADGGKALAI